MNKYEYSFIIQLKNTGRKKFWINLHTFKANSEFIPENKEKLIFALGKYSMTMENMTSQLRHLEYRCIRNAIDGIVKIK